MDRMALQLPPHSLLLLREGIFHVESVILSLLLHGSLIFIRGYGRALRGQGRLSSRRKNNNALIEVQYQIGISASDINEFERPRNQIRDARDLDLLEELCVLHQAVLEGINRAALHLGIDLAQGSESGPPARPAPLLPRHRLRRKPGSSD